MPKTAPSDSWLARVVAPRVATAIAVCALAGSLLVSMLAHPQATSAQSAEDAVVSAVDSYHRSLAEGDTATALALLAADVVILESGGMETKERYRSGHLAGDMRFAQAVPRERGDIEVRVVGDVAWAWSTNVAQGRIGDREVDSQGAELIVLRRIDGAWRIAAVHWSSRQRRPGS